METSSKGGDRQATLDVGGTRWLSETIDRVLSAPPFTPVIVEDLSGEVRTSSRRPRRMYVRVWAVQTSPDVAGVFWAIRIGSRTDGPGGGGCTGDHPLHAVEAEVNRLWRGLVGNRKGSQR